MSNARDEYGDIIDMPHHQSEKRPHMSLSDRAAQFAPFAALRGYEDEISETARQTDKKFELDNDTAALLNERLHIIIESIKSEPEISLTYFIPDNKKEGGKYVSSTGKVRRVDEIQRFIQFKDETKISIDNLLRIEGKIFEYNR
ncbi:MAG: hypothetical protein IJ731_01470 [Eubacterium sp.]|nr:hypothetical protein [Eubacterium sp.]